MKTALRESQTATKFANLVGDLPNAANWHAAAVGHGS
jgi:hypothetical protein